MLSRARSAGQLQREDNKAGLDPLVGRRSPGRPPGLFAEGTSSSWPWSGRRALGWPSRRRGQPPPQDQTQGLGRALFKHQGSKLFRNLTVWPNGFLWGCLNK